MGLATTGIARGPWSRPVRGLNMSKSTQRASVAEVRRQLQALEGPTGRTVKRADEIIARFELFLERAYDINHIGDVTAEHVEQFVNAKGSTGETATATKHVKRTVLRLFFRIARQDFGYHGDPTVDLILPSRTMLKARPLTEDEVMLGRSYSRRTTRESRQPAAWALCEATAITAELGHITVDDLDLDCSNGARVWLHGSRNREARWGFLDDWGATQLERRAKQLKKSKFLIYTSNGSEDSRHVSCCNAIRDVLIRAGLDREIDVKPPSVAAWAGVNALEETGTIDGAARRLGFRSLDAAAKFIAFDWRQ